MDIEWKEEICVATLGKWRHPMCGKDVEVSACVSEDSYYVDLPPCYEWSISMIRTEEDKEGGSGRTDTVFAHRVSGSEATIQMAKDAVEASLVELQARGLVKVED